MDKKQILRIIRISHPLVRTFSRLPSFTASTICNFFWFVNSLYSGRLIRLLTKLMVISPHLYHRHTLDVISSELLVGLTCSYSCILVRHSVGVGRL